MAESPRSGPVVYRSGGLTVEASLADHTIPCLAFALVEEPADAEGPGSRIAHVTDTAWSEASRPGLLGPPRGARRLDCDAFYADVQRSQAEKY